MSNIRQYMPWSWRYKLAERLVRKANQLRMASPLDRYEWVDHRTSPFAKASLEVKALMIDKAMTLEETREELDATL